MGSGHSGEGGARPRDVLLGCDGFAAAADGLGRGRADSQHTGKWATRAMEGAKAKDLGVKGLQER